MLGRLASGRAAPLAGIAALTLVAWAYLAHLAAAPAAMPGMPMPGMGPDLRAWNAAEYAGLFAMWAVMMVAMMLPGEAPAIILCHTLGRQRRGASVAAALTALFVGGYLAVWSGFSAVAAAAQWWVHGLAVARPVPDRTGVLLSAALLLAAGTYQLSPLKAVCLTRCRTPFSLFTVRWPETAGGAFTLGLRHGADCVACCWLLMALLFVGGVMNLLWVGALALLVLVEKIAPGGRRIAGVAGVGFIAWGVGLIVWR